MFQKLRPPGTNPGGLVWYRFGVGDNLKDTVLHFVERRTLRLKLVIPNMLTTWALARELCDVAPAEAFIVSVVAVTPMHRCRFKVQSVECLGTIGMDIGDRHMSKPLRKKPAGRPPPEEDDANRELSMEELEAAFRSSMAAPPAQPTRKRARTAQSPGPTAAPPAGPARSSSTAPRRVPALLEAGPPAAPGGAPGGGESDPWLDSASGSSGENLFSSSEESDGRGAESGAQQVPDAAAGAANGGEPASPAASARSRLSVENPD